MQTGTKTLNHELASTFHRRRLRDRRDRQSGRSGVSPRVFMLPLLRDLSNERRARRRIFSASTPQHGPLENTAAGRYTCIAITGWPSGEGAEGCHVKGKSSRQGSDESTPSTVSGNRSRAREPRRRRPPRSASSIDSEELYIGALLHDSDPDGVLGYQKARGDHGWSAEIRIPFRTLPPATRRLRQGDRRGGLPRPRGVDGRETPDRFPGRRQAWR